MADYDAQPGRPTPAETELSPAQLEADEIDLYTGLRGVAGWWRARRGVIDLLGDVAEFAAQAIPGVDGVGVALIQLARRHTANSNMGGHSGIRRTRSTSSSTRNSTRAPASRVCSRGGPCVSGSLGSDGRWPRFGGRVARMGVHSALSMPLMVGDEVIGAINAYARTTATRSASTPCSWVHSSPAPAAVSVYNAQLLAGPRSGRARCSMLWTAGR